MVGFYFLVVGRDFCDGFKHFAGEVGDTIVDVC